MTRHLRLFVAVVLSPENQQRLRAPMRSLVDAHADVLRAVPDGTAHMTLAFMARTDEDEVPSIDESMRQAVARRGSIALELSGPCVLRARQDPRLIMLPVTTGASQIDALTRDLHQQLASRLPALQLSPAKGAHVTLARFRKNARVSDGRAVEQTLTSSPLASLVLSEEVRAIRLFESTLTPAGPKYLERSATTFGAS